MQTTNRAQHVLPHHGKAHWVVGELIIFKVVGSDTDGAFTLAEELSPPGGGTPPHVHHREDETFYILEGTYEFRLGEDTIRAEAGSVVYAPKHVPHSFTNVGPTSARMLSFVTPPGIEAFLAEVGDEVTDRSSPPPVNQERIERLLAAAPKYGIEMLG